MAYATNPIISRIAWCQREETLARTHSEFEAWRAEEEGLRDALHSIDHRDRYRDCPPDVFQRYVMGFEDGQALIRTVWMNLHSPAGTDV
jgi:hypothetical protein